MNYFLSALKSLLLPLLFFFAIPFYGFPQSNFLPSSFFDVWDKDENRKLSHAEFYEGLSRTSLYESWDTGQDGSLNRQELLAGLEQQYSSRVSASLSSEPQVHLAKESRSGWSDYSLQAVLSSTFGEADLNRDGSINKAEFYTLIFRSMDTDESGYLNPSQCKSYHFTAWVKNEAVQADN